MIGSAQNVPNGVDVFDGYRAQIEALKNDPNATPEFKRQLDAWMQQLEAAIGRASPSSTSQKSPSGGGQNAAQPPSETSRFQGASNGQQNAGQPAPDFPGLQGPRTGPQPGSPYAPGTVPEVPYAGGVLSGAGLPPALQRFAPYIAEASKATGVPEALLAGMVWDESRGDPFAVSKNPGNGLSDIGLMQMNPLTFAGLQAKHPELQGRDPSDPQTNILAAAYYLADLKQQFGNYDLALRGYNSGPNSVDPSNPDLSTTGIGTGDYVKKVNSYAAAIQNGQPLPA